MGEGVCSIAISRLKSEAENSHVVGLPYPLFFLILRSYKATVSNDLLLIRVLYLYTSFNKREKISKGVEDTRTQVSYGWSS